MRHVVVTLAASVALGALACAPEHATSPRPTTTTPIKANAHHDATSIFATGLYADDSFAIADDVIAYEPASKLWSDGAVKHRYARIPAGTHVDATDVDHWRFPKGTQLWKEFVVDGERVETRYLEKTNDSDDVSSWTSVAFAWNPARTDAARAPDGAVDATTGWSIPANTACAQCHQDTDGNFRAIGFSALQLSHDDQLASLVAHDLVSPAPSTLHAPAHAWSQTKRDALLYLHANCAHCHGDGGIGLAVTGMSLQVRYDDVDADHTDLHDTAVDAPLQMPIGDALDRIKPGDPQHSGLFVRMSHRHDALQMPPLGTDVVDDHGVDVVAAFITNLTK